MALDKMVDSSKLNSALTATANAIRFAGGTDSSINFDMVNETGFTSAILGISRGPSSSEAILIVTVPTGSTITATKGGVTLVPTIWTHAADPTLDRALYVIPPSMFDSQNAWTVTATLGTDTASDTVLITTNSEYDLELSYTFWLYHRGNVMDEITGGYEGKTWRASDSSYGAKAPTIVYENTRMYISFQAEGSAVFLNKIPVDITEFNTLKALVDLPATSGTNGNYDFGLLQFNSGSYWYSQVSKSISLRSTTARNETTISIDISNIIGYRYVMFGHNYVNAVNIVVYDIWLE